MAGAVVVKFLGDATGVKKAALETEAAVGGVVRSTSLAKREMTDLASALTGQLAPSLGGISSGLMGPAGIAVGLTVAGAGIAKFVSEGVGEFVKLAEEVDALQDVTGGTAEDASKIVALSKAVGTSAETVASAAFRMSKNIRDNADAFRENGVEIARTANGNVDLTKTLLNVGDAFRQTAQRGGDTNKILTDTFGKSGRAMIDVLERSRAEMDGFLSDAEAHGQIMSQDGVDKALKFEIAMRNLTETIDGYKRKAGEASVGPLTKVLDGTSHAIENTDDGLHRLGSSLGDVTGAVARQIPGVRELLGGYDLLTLGADDGSEAAAWMAEMINAASAALKDLGENEIIAAEAARVHTAEVEAHARAEKHREEAIRASTDAEEEAVRVQEQAAAAVSPMGRVAGRSRKTRRMARHGR